MADMSAGAPVLPHNSKPGSAEGSKTGAKAGSLQGSLKPVKSTRALSAKTKGSARTSARGSAASVASSKPRPYSAPSGGGTGHNFSNSSKSSFGNFAAGVGSSGMSELMRRSRWKSTLSAGRCRQASARLHEHRTISDMRRVTEEPLRLCAEVSVESRWKPQLKSAREVHESTQRLFGDSEAREDRRNRAQDGVSHAQCGYNGCSTSALCPLLQTNLRFQNDTNGPKVFGTYTPHLVPRDKFDSQAERDGHLIHLMHVNKQRRFRSRKEALLHLHPALTQKEQEIVGEEPTLPGLEHCIQQAADMKQRHQDAAEERRASRKEALRGMRAAWQATEQRNSDRRKQMEADIQDFRHSLAQAEESRAAALAEREEAAREAVRGIYHKSKDYFQTMAEKEEAIAEAFMERRRALQAQLAEEGRERRSAEQARKATLREFRRTERERLEEMESRPVELSKWTRELKEFEEEYVSKMRDLKDSRGELKRNAIKQNREAANVYFEKLEELMQQMEEKAEMKREELRQFIQSYNQSLEDKVESRRQEIIAMAKADRARRNELAARITERVASHVSECK